MPQQQHVVLGEQFVLAVLQTSLEQHRICRLGGTFTPHLHQGTVMSLLS